ncbi:MAG: hypothetical protein ACK5JT_19730 [Hyphomicrobiaceae bacterium]
MMALGLSGAANAQQRGPAVSCEVSDFNLNMRLYMPLDPNGTGAPSGPLQGSVQITHQKVPINRRNWSLDGRRPVQFWNVDRQLNMMLMLAGQPDPITIVIKTSARPGDYQYRGEFKLKADGVKVEGQLACVAG